MIFKITRHSKSNRDVSCLKEERCTYEGLNNEDKKENKISNLSYLNNKFNEEDENKNRKISEGSKSIYK